MRANHASAGSRHDDPKPSPGSGPGHVRPREPQAPRYGPWSLVPDRLRPKSVRAKIVSLLMVPVVSLMALWGFATVTTAQNVSDLTRFKEVNATLLAPVGAYVTAVQAERSAAARYLAHPDPSRLDTLNTRGKATDAAAADLRRGVGASSTDTAALSPELPARTDRLMDSAGKLSSLRKRITGEKTSPDDAYTAYTGTIDRGFAVGGALTGISVSGSGADRYRDSEVASEARVVQELARAREMIALTDAIVGGSHADGRMSADRYREFVGATASGRTLMKAAVDDLRPSDEAGYRAVLRGERYQELRALERAIEVAGPGRLSGGDTAAGSAVKWDEAAGSVLQDLRRAETAAGTTAADKADPLAFDVFGRSGIAVVLGLIGVLLSLLISMQIGRGLVVELVGMRNSALELAGRKLPESLRRLHAGEELDIDAEAPVRRRGEDEIGQVGSALNAVHRAAIKAAAERAEALSGISGVYVKLARRSQLLLHRQLGLLDTMERRVEDPAELEDLFRLDHLTTRMRRHAESLIILSGAAPVRGWRKPVPVLDVVRAAVAEVEDFARVEVRVPEGFRIAGAAVADLTHLIAELVENAVVFSPPHTKVRVRGEGVGSGLALEIEDSGLGMSRQALAEANRKIAEASQVDLLDTDRLGLFVVNRLAHRRDIQVSLQQSAYGGVTAVVLIPEELLERGVPQESGQPERPPAAEEFRTVPARHGASLPARARSRSGPHPAPHSAPAAPLPDSVLAAAAGQGPAQVPAQAPGSQEGHPTGEPAPLPRRVRQTHLAPQLRDAPAPDPAPPQRAAGHPADLADPATAATTTTTATTTPGRSPERARATMAALRTGWLSGSGADRGADPATDRAAAGDEQPPPAPESTTTEIPSRGDEA
ncbi:MAG: sensor histidine kinase [Streptomyces sp.]|uniref:sensor histidine kinase n=1 Tax=Streptomyces sp. TaxID=1931 RepID=UPI003D6AA6A7